MLNRLKIIWEWVKGACVIIVLLMILSGIVQENGSIKVVIKEWEKDGNHGNKIE